MALADRHLARDPGLSERPAGGVAARRRDRPGLRCPGPGRRRRGAGGSLACGRPLPNSHADWLGWRLARACQTRTALCQ
jgi:hypothetical protein